MKIEPIAFFRSPFTTKFGLPRQSGIVEALRGRIEFVGDYGRPEALRGLEAYDYVWLLWGFSEHVHAPKHATVRPPLLGGNERVGVWASRSPYRPNNLGLSSVRLVGVDAEAGALEVTGADLMDGTPIYDIKPYLPYADSHAEARAGFTADRPWRRLRVVLPDALAALLPDADADVLRETLALDPRPHYHDDAQRTYGMPFAGWDVRFTVVGDMVQVVSLVKTDATSAKNK